jgi:hypothetical protein
MISRNVGCPGPRIKQTLAAASFQALSTARLSSAFVLLITAFSFQIRTNVLWRTTINRNEAKIYIVHFCILKSFLFLLGFVRFRFLLCLE